MFKSLSVFYLLMSQFAFGAEINDQVADVLAYSYLNELKGSETSEPKTHRGFLVNELQKRALTLEHWDRFNQTVTSYLTTTNAALVSDETIASILGIKPFKAAWIRLYYNIISPKLQIYEGEGLEIFSSMVAFANYERNKQRIDFYRASIRNQTVTNMATELNRPEPSVYRDLWEYRIFVNSAWDENLPSEILYKLSSDFALTDCYTYFDSAVSLYFNRGHSIPKIAALLEVSPEALEDIFHHRGLLRKTAVWTGEEERILRLLYPERTVQEVASILGRTAASVAKRAQILGLQKFKVTHGKPDIEIEPYGQIKKDGKINEGPMESLLKDHLFTPANVIAEMIDVSEGTIRTYRRRLSLPYLNEARTFALNDEAYRTFELKRQKAREEEQLKVIEQEINHYVNTALISGKPELIAARTTDQILGVKYARLVGQHNYAENNSYIFASAIDHWLAFDVGIQKRIKDLRADESRSPRHEQELQILEKFTFFELRKLLLDTYPDSLKSVFISALDRDRFEFQRQFFEKYELQFFLTHGRIATIDEIASFSGRNSKSIVPESQTSHLRIYSSQIQRLLTIDALMRSEGEATKDKSLQERLAKYTAFNLPMRIYDWTSFSENEVNALKRAFDRDRPQVQRDAAFLAAQTILKSATALKANELINLVGKNFGNKHQLIGSDAYSTDSGKGTSITYIFPNQRAFTIAVLQVLKSAESYLGTSTPTDETKEIYSQRIQTYQRQIAKAGVPIEVDPSSSLPFKAECLTSICACLFGGEKFD